MREIRIGIVGVGNCASALVQGIEYYGGKKESEIASGLMHHEICGYRAEHIKVVAAFDIDRRKVGRPLREAIFRRPELHEEELRLSFTATTSRFPWGIPSTASPTT